MEFHGSENHNGMNTATTVTSLFSGTFYIHSHTTFAMISYHLTTYVYTTALSVRSFKPFQSYLAFLANNWRFSNNVRKTCVIATKTSL